MAEGFSTAYQDLNGETQDADFSFKASLTSREVLGKGSFGYVYRQYDELSERYVACKEVDLGLVTEAGHEKKVKTAMKEVSAMRRLDHEHIVKYYGYKVIQDQHKSETRVLIIYMEYALGGSVKNRLTKEGAFNEIQAIRYTWQMLLGVSYLHRQRIIHRDLKCCNLLLDGEDNIKLADFGIAKECHHSTFESKITLHTEACGTAHYMAPEVMAGEEYGRKADIWSAGATVVEMLTTQPPWYRLKDFQVMYKINLKSEPAYVLDSSLSGEVRSFLDVIFNYDSEKRPLAEELLEHDWFSEITEVPFTRKELLGAGCFEKVCRKFDKLSKQYMYMACKEVDLSLIPDTEYQKKIERAMKEVSVMKKLQHLHIVKLYDCTVLKDTRTLCIYMEYVSGGSVKDRLNKEGAFNETQAIKYIWQMLQAVSYLHRQHIIHRDLKCSNMLLDGKDNLKLTGFGIAKQYPINNSTNDSMEAHGTVHYMAPEVMAGEEYGKKSDIWSAGATIVEMLTTQPPWYQLKDFQVMYKISLKTEPEYVLDSSLGPAVRSFLDVIFNYDSKRRPSAEQLLEQNRLLVFKVLKDSYLSSQRYKTAEEAQKKLQEFEKELLKSMESVQEPKVTSEEYKLSIAEDTKKALQKVQESFKSMKLAQKRKKPEVTCILQ